MKRPGNPPITGKGRSAIPSHCRASDSPKNLPIRPEDGKTQGRGHANFMSGFLSHPTRYPDF